MSRVNKWSMSTLQHEFACAQMDRVLEKAEEGYLGWDSSLCVDDMRQRLIDKSRGGITSKDYIDVANLAMFLYAHAIIEEGK